MLFRWFILEVCSSQNHLRLPTQLNPENWRISSRNFSTRGSLSKILTKSDFSNERSLESFSADLKVSIQLAMTHRLREDLKQTLSNKFRSKVFKVRLEGYQTRLWLPERVPDTTSGFRTKFLILNLCNAWNAAIHFLSRPRWSRPLQGRQG